MVFLKVQVDRVLANRQFSSIGLYMRYKGLLLRLAAVIHIFAKIMESEDDEEFNDTESEISFGYGSPYEDDEQSTQESTQSTQETRVQSQMQNEGEGELSEHEEEDEGFELTDISIDAVKLASTITKILVKQMSKFWWSGKF